MKFWISPINSSDYLCYFEALYGFPPCLAHASSNSCSRISAPRLSASPVSFRLSSHMPRSSLPATRSSGFLLGWSSSWRTIHWPLKWAYHHPLLRFSLSWWDGDTKGTRKNLSACSASAPLEALGGDRGAKLESRAGIGGGGGGVVLGDSSAAREEISVGVSEWVEPVSQQ